MKLIDIWKRIGKQPLKVTQHTDAIVFVNGCEYVISNIKYESGKFIGFETKQKPKQKLEYLWYSEPLKPKKDEWVIVKDKSDKEYPFHQWNGYCWYAFVGDKKHGYDGWRTDVDVVSWRYQ